MVSFNNLSTYFFQKDGCDLPKLITFEEEGSTSQGSTRINIPMQAKMVVNEEAEGCITQFIQKFFEVYDSDHRENLVIFNVIVMKKSRFAIFLFHQLVTCTSFCMFNSMNQHFWLKNIKIYTILVLHTIKTIIRQPEPSIPRGATIYSS